MARMAVRGLAMLLAALTLAPTCRAGTASISPKSNAMKSHQVTAGASIAELPAEELLAPEDGEAEDSPFGGGCGKDAEEMTTLMRKVAMLERLQAEQDTALAKLKRTVRELRGLRAKEDQLDGADASCPAAPVLRRCEHCPE
mmetsp:Transcript_90430/g.240189  ORF Transcript_90430/g.240189 Transcript_90430/m.240189 type:complete len:142 (-) Transcript_90430:101-526(-)